MKASTIFKARWRNARVPWALGSRRRNRNE
jgi:hypothetical protein